METLSVGDAGDLMVKSRRKGRRRRREAEPAMEESRPVAVESGRTQTEEMTEALARAGGVDPVVPIGFGLTVQFVLMTTEIARLWKTQVSPVQRDVKANPLASLVRDITLGMWRFNGAPVIFDRDGNLIDGQHRVDAVIRTGLPCVVMVLRGVAVDAYATLDSGRPRCGSDALKAKGAKCVNILRAVVTLFHRYEGGVIHTDRLVSPAFADRLDDENPALRASVEAWASDLGWEIYHSRAVPCFAHYLFSRLNSSEADQFMRLATTDAGHPEGSPILAMRRAVQREKFGAEKLLPLFIKAWNLWRGGKSGPKKKPLELGADDMRAQPL